MMPRFDLIEKHKDRFVPNIPSLPQGKFVSIVILRETKDTAIFTTEGDMLDVEKVPAGLQDLTPVDRAVMFKRKQVAPERRTGKALLRSAGVFPLTIGDREIDGCHLLDGLCGACPDCLLYGYAAVVGEGARRSRVLTDSAFTVQPYEKVQEFKEFNYIDEKTMTSGTVTRFDHLKPGTILPCVETLVDVTADEFIYVLGNILKTTRYGKEASREGFVRNHIVAIAFSDMELFSNLELTQAFYDAFKADDNVRLDDGYLTLEDFRTHLPNVLDTLLQRVFGVVTVITDREHTSERRVTWETGLREFLEGLRDFYANEDEVRAFLRRLTGSAVTFAATASVAEETEEGEAPETEGAEGTAEGS
jgi:CRISPR-associated protein Csc2